MSFEDTAKADFEKAEDAVKRAEQDAIKWFHDQRVAQHNEAVGAIQKGNEDQPKTVSSVDELPAYDPDAVAAPVSLTPVMPPTSGVPDNVGHGTVTVVDPPEDDPKSNPDHPVDQGEAITPEGPVEAPVIAEPTAESGATEPVVVEEHPTQQV